MAETLYDLSFGIKIADEMHTFHTHRHTQRHTLKFAIRPLKIDHISHFQVSLLKHHEETMPSLGVNVCTRAHTHTNARHTNHI